jgi:hypothetical protein
MSPTTVPSPGSTPSTNAVQATIKPPVEFVPCGGFAIGTDAVWVTGCSEQKQLIRIDPATNTVAEIIKVDGYGNYPTMINGFAWVSLDRGGARNGQIVRISRLTDSVDRVLVPGAPFGGGGNLVVAPDRSGSLTPTTGQSSACRCLRSVHSSRHARASSCACTDNRCTAHLSWVRTETQEHRNMYADLGLLILRVVAGGVVLSHGLQKLGYLGGFGFDGTAGFINSLGFKPSRPWTARRGRGGGRRIGAADPRAWRPDWARHRGG